MNHNTVCKYVIKLIPSFASFHVFYAKDFKSLGFRGGGGGGGRGGGGEREGCYSRSTWIKWLGSCGKNWEYPFVYFLGFDYRVHDPVSRGLADACVGVLIRRS